MKLFDLFKKYLFNENNINIINISDLIQIPGRTYYKNDIHRLNQIDKYKYDYIELLNQKRKITTKDISNDNLLFNNKMYTDLILMLIFKDNYYDINNQSLLDNKIIIYKLKIYLNEIIKIEDEIIERLIALLELEKEKRIIHLNKSTLKLEISNLKLSLHVLLTQKISIINEIDSYLTHISITNKTIDEEEFEKRKEIVLNDCELFFDVNKMFNTSELEYTTSEKQIDKQISMIAIIETKLEEYVYNNKITIDSLKNTINDINNNTNLNSDLRQQLYIIEYKYEVFKRYGRFLVTDDDFINLYNARFKVLTNNLLSNCNSDGSYSLALFNQVSGLEKEIYDNQIMKRKQKIINNENIIIKELFGKNTHKVISMLVEHFRTYGTKDSSNKLYNRYEYLDTIRLIISFDSIDNFYKLLCNNSIQRPHTSKLLNELKKLLINKEIIEINNSKMLRKMI